MAWESHLIALRGLRTRVMPAAVAAVDAALAPIAPDARARVTVDTGVLESTIHQIPAKADGPVAMGLVSVGSPQDKPGGTLTGWPSNVKHPTGLHGPGGAAGMGPMWGDVGYEIFQEFGTSTTTPAVHYLEDATVEALPGMLGRMGSAFTVKLAA